jgi:hypothetical protein
MLIGVISNRVTQISNHVDSITMLENLTVIEALRHFPYSKYFHKYAHAHKFFKMKHDGSVVYLDVVENFPFQ